jgi:hypothetical protein
MQKRRKRHRGRRTLNKSTYGSELLPGQATVQSRVDIRLAIRPDCRPCPANWTRRARSGKLGGDARCFGAISQLANLHSGSRAAFQAKTIVAAIQIKDLRRKKVTKLCHCKVTGEIWI